jgi:mRNA interferase RelE/StbE
MAHAIRLKRSAIRELGKLQKRDQQRISARIDALAVDPRCKGAEPFKGVEKAYRIRVGAFRIVYQIDDEHRIVQIIKIGDRKEVCRRR